MATKVAENSYEHPNLTIWNSPFINHLDEFLFNIDFQWELKIDNINYKHLLKATQIDINFLNPKNKKGICTDGEINQFRKKEALLKSILSNIQVLKTKYIKEVYDELQSLKIKLEQYLDLNIIGLSIISTQEKTFETNYLIKEKSRRHFRGFNLKSITRDIRRIYRTIMNLIYKNLDDEKHDKIQKNFIKKNFIQYLNYIKNESRLYYRRIKCNFCKSRLITS